ncbi:DUF1381 domain-containing protein [Staphylococcus simulans]
MTQYLIIEFTDDTGYKHAHVIKPKPNQTFTVVEADSKKEAKKIYEEEDND